MSITRSPRRVTWTQIDNEIINDERFKMDTLGMLVYLLSKPDHWNVNTSHLSKRLKVGRSKIYRMLGELQEMGYASYIKNNDGTTDWNISESRIDTPYVENQHMPHVEKPNVGNQHVYINTDKQVTTDIKHTAQTEFERWWKLYPKKVGKKAALAAWKKAKPDADTLIEDTINRASDRKWIPNENGKTFIKDPVRYITNEQWNDEIEPPTKTMLCPADRSKAIMDRMDREQADSHSAYLESQRGLLT